LVCTICWAICWPLHQERDPNEAKSADKSRSIKAGSSNDSYKLFL
jgi:hypothetical protein